MLNKQDPENAPSAFYSYTILGFTTAQHSAYLCTPVKASLPPSHRIITTHKATSLPRTRDLIIFLLSDGAYPTRISSQ
ncbi:hypothetical protein V490_07447 [Pseudogymnoascus sp. VKM F-3557]|nr:hypothetical protein V490_07447 [Pseudogymnoascus sp. VKM F-3557]